MEQAILVNMYHNKIIIKSKNHGKKVLNNFINPIIKNLNPLKNMGWEVQKIS
jgi:hypothetical protein